MMPLLTTEEYTILDINNSQEDTWEVNISFHSPFSATCNLPHLIEIKGPSLHEVLHVLETIGKKLNKKEEHGEFYKSLKEKHIVVEIKQGYWEAKNQIGDSFLVKNEENSSYTVDPYKLKLLKNRKKES